MPPPLVLSCLLSAVNLLATASSSLSLSAAVAVAAVAIVRSVPLRGAAAALPLLHLLPPLRDGGAPRKIPSNGGCGSAPLSSASSALAKSVSPPPFSSTPSHRCRRCPVGRTVRPSGGGSARGPGKFHPRGLWLHRQNYIYQRRGTDIFKYTHHCQNLILHGLASM